MIEKEILEKVTSQILEKKQPILQTGFSDLDSILSGLENSSIIAIGARPSMGKTAFITAIMLNLLEQKKKCLLFSLEMSKSKFIKRLIPPITEIEATKKALESNNLEEIKEATEKLTKVFYEMSEQLYKNANPGTDANTNTTADTTNENNSGNDGTVYDADYKVEDDNK